MTSPPAQNLILDSLFSSTWPYLHTLQSHSVLHTRPLTTSIDQATTSPFAMSTPTLVQPRPTLEDLLQQTTRQWHGYIANKDDAITVGQNIILSGHIGPDQGEGEEYDYPMTPEDESELVRILYEAMCDFSDPFEERNGKTSFQVERLKMVSDLQMEVVAWDVLVSADQPTDIMTLRTFLARMLTRSRQLGGHRGSVLWIPRLQKVQWRYQVPEVRDLWCPLPGCRQCLSSSSFPTK